MSLFTSIPNEFWFAITVILIYLGEKVQQIYLIHILKRVAMQAQPAPIPPHQPAVVPAPPPVVTPPAPPVMPSPAPVDHQWAGFPPWFIGGLHELGFHETGNNQGIDKYIALARTGADGDPWCAIFANAMVEQAGLRGTRSPSSQSFRTDPNFVQLSGPAPGALVVFWRISQASGLGHVGFYRGEDSTSIWTLGGNENDAVLIEALPKSSATFGVIGYWWPKSVALPTVGAIIMPSGAPTVVSTDPTTGQVTSPKGIPANQSNITATVFGGQHSAYGGPISDTLPGAALPFRFPDPRPKVRITSLSTSKSVIADIVDVGPWNTHDPYWQTGQRPQSESGYDTTGRKTNLAGIDLTAASAAALGLDGKGKVDWDFLSPSVSTT